MSMKEQPPPIREDATRLFFIEELDIPSPSKLQLVFGSKSLFAFHEDFFIKILPKKPFVHEILIKHSPFINERAPFVDLYKYSPRLLAFRILQRENLREIMKSQPRLAAFLKNVQQGYLYVFERRDLIKIHHLLQKDLLNLDKDTCTKIMKSLIYTINLLHLEGFTYHDLCGDNLLWDINTNQAFLVDLDSSVPIRWSYEEAKAHLVGQHTYHRVYLYLRRKKEYRKLLYDLNLFGSCLIFNYFLALMMTSFTKQYHKINYYAQELPKVLLLDAEPTMDETKILLQKPRLKFFFQRSLQILENTIKKRQPSRINALLGLIDLMD